MHLCPLLMRSLPHSLHPLVCAAHVEKLFSKRLHTTVASVSVPSEGRVVAEEQSTNECVPSYKAYLDFRFIQENVDLLKDNCWKRNLAADPEFVARLHTEYIRSKQECERLRVQRNENSRSMKGSMPKEKREKLVENGVQLKQQISKLEREIKKLENLVQTEGQKLPNLTHPDVPVGDEAYARTIKTVGKRREFDFPIKDHTALGVNLDIIDFENAASVAGSKFHYLKNEAALLEMALLNWTFQTVSQKGFTPIITPDLIRTSILEKCGFQPRAQNTQTYNIRDSDLALTGTSEVPLGGLYMDQILDEKDLPIKMVAFGHCFRTEAGAPGTASKGLYRVHQFSKVEMFVLCTPEQSEEMLKELIEIEEELYHQLGFHFKILDMPTGDLGAPAYRKFDIEAWMPGLKRYGEISSASSCTDYQSRRLNIRYRPNKGIESKKKVPNEFVHTLNATACAVPRLIVTILENFQENDGSIKIPRILQPYMNGVETIVKK